MRQCRRCHLILEPKEFKYIQTGTVCNNCYIKNNTDAEKVAFNKHKNKYIREEYWNAKIKLRKKDIYTSLVTLEDLKYLKLEGYSFIIKGKYL